MGSAQAVGRYGEDVAARYVQQCGWQILARNWRSGRGELDVVALDGDCLVVIEVKTRRSVEFGDPLEAITPTKAARLRRLTAAWLEQAGTVRHSVRIDAIGVTIPRRGAPVIDHRRGVA
ncbi:MAG: YraN family protein [Actinomycetes bacterium]